MRVPESNLTPDERAELEERSRTPEARRRFLAMVRALRRFETAPLETRLKAAAEASDRAAEAMRKEAIPLPEPEGRIVTEKPNRGTYHSEQCLADDGWTQHAIAKWLPAVPDLIGPSPFGAPGDPLMKYWLRRRVSRLLRNKDYQNWRSKVANQIREKREKDRIESLGPVQRAAALLARSQR